MPKLEPASIYLTLFACESRHEVHRWAIFVPHSASNGYGRLFRVVEKPTPRGRISPPPASRFEAKELDIFDDPRLFLLVKLGGAVDQLPLDDLTKILAGVSIPEPHEEYSHFFDGRTWVIKAIMRLSAYGIIKSRRLEIMERDIHDLATQALHSHNVNGGWTLAKL